MRVNPKVLANMQSLYGDGQNATGLPEGTYVSLAASKYVKDNDKNRDKVLSRDEVTLSQEAFDKLDKDKSGKLDVKEMKAALKGQDAAIEAYYKNRKPGGKQGDLASALLKSPADQAGGGYASLAATRFIKENDKNGDKALSSAEAALPKAAFDKLDANKDGRLDLKEVRAGLQGQEDAIEDYYKNGAPGGITGLASTLLQSGADQAGAAYASLAAAKFIKDNDVTGDRRLSGAEADLPKAAFDKLDADKNGRLDQREVQTALKAKEANYKALYKSNASGQAIADLTSSLLKTI